MTGDLPPIDDVVLAFMRAGSAAFEGLPGLQVLAPGPEVMGLLTGVPVPTLNGVWVGVRDPDLDLVARLVDASLASGLPFCVQLRPDVDPATVALVARRGLVAAFETPLMVRPGTPMPVPELTGLRLERIPPEQAARHSDLVADAMGAPREVVARLMSPETLAHPAVRTYVGTIDGTDVVTAVGVLAGGTIGVFNVGTAESLRRRGLGGIATARVVADGLADGASFATLQSSPMALGLYRELGFDVVEQWQVWLPGDAA